MNKVIQPTKAARHATMVICNINGNAPRYTLADAREAEIELLQHHMEADTMQPEEIQRAKVTIAQIKRGIRRFGGKA